jgi:hypothetical protein
MDKLGTDLASPEYLHGIEQAFWGQPDRDGNTLYISVHAPDGRTFLGQFDCSNYGTQPIRCLFVNPATRQVDLKFWPDGNAEFEKWIKFKAARPFICWPQDRGAIDIGNHTEWQSLREWQKEDNQIVAYLDFLRQMLHVRARGYLRRK